MAYKQFRDTVLTNNGFSVANKAASGNSQYKITRAVSTDADLAGYKEQDLKNLTKLPDEIDSGILMDYNAKGTNQDISVIKINYDNSSFTKGYGIRAVGLYAQADGSSTEFLHSVTVSDSEVIIPEVSSNIYDGFYLDMAIFTGSNKNIKVDIANENNATVKYVNDAIANLKIDDRLTDMKNHFNSNDKIFDDRIKDLESNGVKCLGYLKNGQDLNDLKTTGYLIMDGVDVSTIGHYPDVLLAYDNGNAWGYVSNLGNGWTKQEVLNVTANDNEVTAYRIYENSWHQWKAYASLDDVNNSLSTAKGYTDNSVKYLVNSDTFNNKASDLQNQINDRVSQSEYKPHMVDLQNQINSRVNNDIFYSNINDLKGKITTNDNSINRIQDDVNNNAYKAISYQRNLTDDDDVFDVDKLGAGIFELKESKALNLPYDLFSGKLIILSNKTGSQYNLFTEILIDEVNGSTFINYVNSWPYQYSGWKELVTKNQLDAAINQLSSNIEQASKNSLQFRGDAPNPLSKATLPGIYNMPGNVNYSDAPDNANRGQLIVLTTGGLLNQMILSNHGDTFNRSIGGNGTTSWK